MAKYFDIEYVKLHASLCTVCGNRISLQTTTTPHCCGQKCCSDRCLQLHQTYCGFEKQQLFCGTARSTREICMCLDIANVCIQISDMELTVGMVARYGMRKVFELVLKDEEKLNSKAIPLMDTSTGCGTSLVHFLQFVWKKVAHRPESALRRLEWAAIVLIFGLRFTEASVSVPELRERPPVECIALTEEESIQRALKNIEKSFASMWKRDRDNCVNDVVYFLRFYNRTHVERGAVMQMTDAHNEDALWRATSQQPHTLAHSFFVRLIADAFVVVQSYYGYYDNDAWLDWDKELQQSQQFTPVIDSQSGQPWHHPLEKRPRFRGLLSVKRDGEAFAKAIDRIAQENSMNDYRDVTGVCVGNDCLEPAVFLATVRLNMS